MGPLSVFFPGFNQQLKILQASKPTTDGIAGVTAASSKTVKAFAILECLFIATLSSRNRNHLKDVLCSCPRRKKQVKETAFD